MQRWLERHSCVRRTPTTPCLLRAGPRQYSKRVEKMRSVCKAATITIPPSLYSRNKGEGALEAALEEPLAKHGLDADSGAAVGVAAAGLGWLLLQRCAGAALFSASFLVADVHAAGVIDGWVCVREAWCPS